MAIGLCLTLIHLISIPVTNTSVNPARSSGPTLFVGGWAVQQLWLFWVAPIAGALLAGVVFRALFEPDVEEPPVRDRNRHRRRSSLMIHDLKVTTVESLRLTLRWRNSVTA
jgi:Major intrinsic protein